MTKIYSFEQAFKKKKEKQEEKMEKSRKDIFILLENNRSAFENERIIMNIKSIIRNIILKKDSSALQEMEIKVNKIITAWKMDGKNVWSKNLDEIYHNRINQKMEM